MHTKLIEFQNTKDQNLRGILTLPSDEIKKGVICLHGFERCATTEKKFKEFVDRLAEEMIATLRFDFSGCGLSDGDFKFTTIEKQGEEFFYAIKKFEEKIENHEFSVIAHSLGACVLANQIENIREKIKKIILIAPALNQKNLLRYWFVASQMKRSNPNVEITWDNYKNYFNEEEFQKDCAKNDKMTKTNYINSEYFLSGKDFDFSDRFQENNNVLHVHGDKDLVVPIKSLNVEFKNQIIIENGDHDLEKPNQMEQWMQKGVDFLLE
ncbi:alpha/beta hydrolase [Candidatus Parcubacteria bacterium]|nr:alpha/beta hydrolase [Candidatus Parcubacteria bacterium]